MPHIAKPDIPDNLLRCHLHPAGVERWDEEGTRRPALDPGFVVLAERIVAHYGCGCVLTHETAGVTIPAE